MYFFFLLKTKLYWRRKPSKKLRLFKIIKNMVKFFKFTTKNKNNLTNQNKRQLTLCLCFLIFCVRCPFGRNFFMLDVRTKITCRTYYRYQWNAGKNRKRPPQTKILAVTSYAHLFSFVRKRERTEKKKTSLVRAPVRRVRLYESKPVSERSNKTSHAPNEHIVFRCFVCRLLD